MIVFCLCGAQEQILVKPGDKRGFVCYACGGLFDVSDRGEVVRSPLKSATIVESDRMPLDWRINGRIVGDDK